MGTLICAGTATADPVGKITQFPTGLPNGTGIGVLVAGGDGNLWFSFGGSASSTFGIGRLTPTGTVTLFRRGFSSGHHPTWLGVGPDGNVWFDVAGAGPPAGQPQWIGRVTPEGRIAEFPATIRPNGILGALAPGSDGNVWYEDTGGAVGRITPDGESMEFPVAQLHSLTPGPDGNLWFVENRPAIGRITPQGQVSEFTQGLDLAAGPSWLVGVTAGFDGELWFTGVQAAGIGKVTPQGAISYHAALGQASLGGLVPGPDGHLWLWITGSHYSVPSGLYRLDDQGHPTIVFASGLALRYGPTLRADGNLWFVDANGAIGRIGIGMPPAEQARSRVHGSGTVSVPLSCQSGTWTRWGGLTPSMSLFGSDGYQWMRDGVAILRQTTSRYVPTPADAGHRLACRVTVTYPIPLLVTAASTSAPLTIKPPAVSGLSASPSRFELTGRWTDRHCVATTRANRNHLRCSRRVEMAVKYRLSFAGIVKFTIQRQAQGRLVHGRCVAATRANRRHRACGRFVGMRGSILRTGSPRTIRFVFSGAIGGHSLQPGHYRLVATTVARGIAGTTRTVSFTLAR